MRTWKGDEPAATWSCGKLRYETKRLALQALAVGRKKGHSAARAYRCSDCRGYHLTSRICDVCGGNCQPEHGVHPAGCVYTEGVGWGIMPHCDRTHKIIATTHEC